VSGIRLFSIGSIPVAASPWYFALLAYWLWDGELVRGVIWAVVVTVSILVHELGHALVARHYRLQPRILLWGLGGLCIHERAERDRHDAFIVAAGPGAGLLLGAVTWGLSLALPPIADPVLAMRFADTVQMLLWVNILWSFVNLLPLWPLDGGLLFRLGMLQLTGPKTADKVTHGVSLGIIAVAFGAAYMMQSIFIFALAGFAAWRNVQALKGEVSSGAFRPVSQMAKTLLAQAEVAYAAEDYREAARLCHQLRALDNPDQTTMQRAWQILGPSMARFDDPDHALSFLKRAPPNADVVEGLVECYFQLEMHEELDALIASKDFGKVDLARREQILAVVEPAAERSRDTHS